MLSRRFLPQFSIIPRSYRSLYRVFSSSEDGDGDGSRGRESERESGLELPVRERLHWRESAFYDEEKIEKEMRRVFDVCHGLSSLISPHLVSYPHLSNRTNEVAWCILYFAFSCAGLL